MSVDAWVALGGVAALVLGAIAGLTKAIGDVIVSFRRPDKTPAPASAIAIPVEADGGDDIDYRAYADMKDQLAKAETRAEKAERDRDYWIRRASGIHEDTEPT